MAVDAPKFRSQLIVGWLVSLALVLALAATAIGALRVATTDEDQLAHKLVDDLATVQRLQLQAEEVVVATRGYLFTGEPRDRARVELAQRGFEGQLAEIRAGRAETAAVERAALAYTVAAELLALQRAVDADPRELVPQFDETVRPKRTEFERSVATFAADQRSVFDQSRESARSVARDAQLMLVSVALAVIALGVILAHAVIRRLSSQFERLQAAQREAEVAVRARDELLAVVSHDLRNPLETIVLGASLVDETARDERTGRHARAMQGAATRMQHMIDELLETAQLDASELVLNCEACDTRRLVDETVEQFELRAAKRCVELTAVPLDASIIGDRERILEILSNLVGNALKFTPPGGRIEIRAEPHDRDVRFVVADTGPGIAADQLSHLFERYWQSKPGNARTGLGLGLYICKRLVEAQHGSIGVASTLGKGTTFWFDLPIETHAVT